MRSSSLPDTDRGQTAPSLLDTSREKMIHLIRFDLFHNIGDKRNQTDKGREQ